MPRSPNELNAGYKKPIRRLQKGNPPSNTRFSGRSDAELLAGAGHGSGDTMSYVPPPRDNTPIKDLRPDLFGGGGGGGGGGGYDPYAAQRAEEERRRAAMRKAIQDQYSRSIGTLQGLNRDTTRGLNQGYTDARNRMNPIYDQNQRLTGDYSRQLASVAQNASRGVLDQGALLSRDLQGQGGYGMAGLQGQISGDVRDILGARAAGDQYNTRLAQVMGLSRQDNSAMLSAILQGAQAQRSNSYQQQYNQMLSEQALKLAELA